jgi:hypothetical protein
MINKVLRAKNLIPEEGFVEPDIAGLDANFLWQLRRNQVSHAVAAILALLTGRLQDPKPSLRGNLAVNKWIMPSDLLGADRRFDKRL